MKFEKYKLITKHEFLNYFRSSLALVFLLIYLVASNVAVYYMGNFFNADRADLSFFFVANAWMYAFFTPAIAMRLIAEERRLGTFEFLTTLPLSAKEIVVGKFLGSLAFLALSLLLLFPLFLTLFLLGNPDPGVLLTQIIGTLLIGAAYLSLSLFVSAKASSPLIAFLISAVLCLFLNISGSDMILNMLAGSSEKTLKVIKTFSFFDEARPFFMGIISFKSVLFFGLFIWLFLFGAITLVKEKR